MRNSIYRITLDMHDVASQVQITAKQHDTARKLHITLSENGSPYTIEEGCRAVLSINRPGSTVINDDCEIKLNGSVIMYDFNSQTTEVLGINECEVKLYDHDGDIITSPRFTLLVDENVYNDGEDHGIDHRNILNRDKEDQHPIKAITGLEKELESKANAEKIYAEIALDRSRIDNIAALGQNSVIEVQKKYNTTGATTPLTFSLDNDGKCVVIIYYYKSAPNTETYSSSVLVNSQSIFTKTLDGAAGTYLEEVEFDGHSGDIVTITRDNANVSINSVLYVTNKSTDTELADIRLGADGTIYPCAGDAVREQVSSLKDDVDSQVGALKSDIVDNSNSLANITTRVMSPNRINPIEISHNTNVTPNGEVVPYDTLDATGFINAKKGDILYFTAIDSSGNYKYILNSVQFALYDRAKNFISKSSFVNGYVIDDDNCEYVRVIYSNSGTYGTAKTLSLTINFFPEKVDDIVDYFSTFYVLNDVVNVECFGAVHNGEKDDTQAIMDACDYAMSVGKKLFLPSGKYRCNLSFSSVKQLYIFGDGMWKSELIPYDITKPVIAFYSESFAERNQYIVIRNIRIGDRNTSIIGQTGLQLHTIQNSKLEDIEFCGLDTAIECKGAMDFEWLNVNILHCGNIEKSTYAITFDFDNFTSSNAIKAHGLRMEICPLMISAVKMRHCYFTDCKFEQAAPNTSGGKNTFYFSQCKENAFTNCMFVASNTTNTSAEEYIVSNGKHLIKSENALPQSDIRFIGCSFTTPDNASTHWIYGYNINADNCNFSNCNGDTTGFAFHLFGKNHITNSSIISKIGKKLFAFDGNYISVEADINLPDDIETNKLLTATAKTEKALFKYALSSGQTASEDWFDNQGSVKIEEYF